jgi:hypothetical protein
LTDGIEDFLKEIINKRSMQSERSKMTYLVHIRTLFKEDVYEAMVESGVAVKLDTEQMFDKDANVVMDEKLMDRKPTKYQFVHPEQMIFVDKTGCNTNQKDDGYAGGEQFLLPQEKEDVKGFGNVGTATDIHHTVCTLRNTLGVPFTLCYHSEIRSRQY